MNNENEILVKSKQLLKKGNNEETIDYIKSNLETLNDEIKIKCLLILGKAYTSIEELDEALQNYSKCYQYYEKEGNTMEVSKILFNMSKVWAKKGEQDQAKIYSQKALELNPNVENVHDEF